GSSWKAGVGITTPCVRMDRSATSRRRRRPSSRHSRGRPCNPNQRCRPRWRHDHHCTNNQIGPVRGGRSDRIGIRVLRDPYTAKPNVLFYTTKRVGGGVVNFEALKLLKIST